MSDTQVEAEPWANRIVGYVPAKVLEAVGIDPGWGDLAHVLRAEGFTLHPPRPKEPA